MAPSDPSGGDSPNSKPPAFPGAPEMELPFEGTRVDLGDDLLEHTAMLPMPGVPLVPRPRPAPVPETPGEIPEALTPERRREDEPTHKPYDSSGDRSGPLDIDDELESAKILSSEGLLEDAKKVLRRILLTDPSHLVARQRLEEIHQVELKQIFGEGTQITPRRRLSSTDALRAVNSEALMRQLDRDLKLGVFDEGTAGETLATGLSLFRTQEAMDGFAKRLDRQLAGTSGRDRLDVGIAFLEMGLHDLAVRQFRAATRDAETSLAAAGLVSFALILAGRPFEAILTLEQVLADTEVARDEKVDFLYLMARAHEGLGRDEMALQWYSQLQETNADYRDTRDRVRSLRDRASLRKGPAPRD